MNSQESSTSTKATKLGQHSMGIGMAICCAVMLLPFGAYLLAGKSAAGTGSALASLAPLALCLGVHFVMHRMMGKSCNGAKSEKPAEGDAIESRQAQ